eukprot:scaffold114756_cov15-Tisochrysis_lutea.AAC.1
MKKGLSQIKQIKQIIISFGHKQKRSQRGGNISTCLELRSLAQGTAKRTVYMIDPACDYPTNLTLNKTLFAAAEIVTATWAWALCQYAWQDQHLSAQACLYNQAFTLADTTLAKPF